MKLLHIKLMITPFFASVFLTACIERIMQYDLPSKDVNDYKNAKENYDVARKDYALAKEDYELAKKNYQAAHKKATIEPAQDKKQTSYRESSLLVSIYATPQVNIDPYGRAGPVSVHIFQLDEADSFDTLDYNTLVEIDNPASIDSTFINKQVLQFFPDEKQKVFLTLDKEVHYIGILATYTDTATTRWRAVVPLNSTQNILTVTLGEDGIQVMQ